MTTVKNQEPQAITDSDNNVCNPSKFVSFLQSVLPCCAKVGDVAVVVSKDTVIVGKTVVEILHPNGHVPSIHELNISGEADNEYDDIAC
ncbi:MULTISPECIES: hypothetical protein [unclassified Candidatus Tisiphia]|uniref:hypothetical protein n=1 Tax=unclassified Candidatus Tisiphia TaxID=2996318 RepID=UPI00312CABBF